MRDRADAQLSGAVPITPERACISGCAHYGAACAGTVFSETKDRCYMKGRNYGRWEWAKGDKGDSTTLQGGCGAWSAIGESALLACPGGLSSMWTAGGD